jgi:integrase
MGHSVYQVNSYLEENSAGREEHDAVSLLYDREGNRKYLTVAERRAFLAATQDLPSTERTFCLMLAYTGARISEVLALSPARIDLEARVVMFESLKKRRRGHFRAVPLPAELLAELESAHGVRVACLSPAVRRERLWPCCRTTAWSRVKRCMIAAEIVGPRATAKGLRHGFAVASLQSGVPINLVRKWLGHSRLSTTEIYADAVGEEEQAFAQRFWRTFDSNAQVR